MPDRFKDRQVKPDSRRVRFCFERLSDDNPQFLLKDCSKEFLQSLLLELARYESFTVDQFRMQDHSSHRHTLYFPDTSEPNGFPIDPTSDELWTDEAWQFGLAGERGSTSDNWRVHGFIDENAFYIVWLDPGHNLSRNKREEKTK